MTTTTSTTAVPPTQSVRLARLTRAAAEQGDVFRNRGRLIFCHPDAVRDILVTHDRSFGKAPMLRWARWTLGQGLLTADGDLHRRQRPLIQPALHPKRLAGYADAMARHAAAVDWTDGQSIDAHHELMAVTLHIVAEALFGAALGPEADAISVAMDYNVRAFLRVIAPFGVIRALIPSPFGVRYLLSRRKLLNVLRRFIAQRRASGEARDDLLGRLLSARTPDGRPAMGERQLIDECVTLFAAGHETTAGTLTYTLWLLAHHPQVQAKLADEVDGVLPTPDALPTIEHVDRLPYTRQVLSESMRLFPPAWLQGRQALADVTVNGTPVRKGQVAMVTQWVTHRDARWWSRPDVFDPDRFATDDPDRPRWAYFPFGGGSRVCVGEAFAWAEMVLVLSTLVRRWRFQPMPTDGPLKLEPGITLRPGGPVELRVRRR
jgi:cytochrome P450